MLPSAWGVAGAVTGVARHTQQVHTIGEESEHQERLSLEEEVLLALEAG